MMPPPMTTISACVGRLMGGSSVLVAVGVERRVEPREVLRGVGDVVDAGRVEMQLRHHAPHRLAQQRGALHRGMRATDFGDGRGVEIGREQRIGLRPPTCRHWRPRRRGRTSRSRSRHIRSRSARAARRRRGNLPAKDRCDRTRSAAPLAPAPARRRARDNAGSSPRHAASAGFQRARVVADHVERPEHEAGAGDMFRHLVVEAAHRAGRSARYWRARPRRRRSSRRDRPSPSRPARSSAPQARSRPA